MTNLLTAPTKWIIQTLPVAQTATAGDDITRGYAIAVAGLVIVFIALLLISMFIASLPRVLAVVSENWPEVEEPHVRPTHPESQVPDDDAVLAAIGFVLHTEMQRQLALDQPSRKTSI